MFMLVGAAMIVLAAIGISIVTLFDRDIRFDNTLFLIGATGAILMLVEMFMFMSITP